MKTIEEIRNDLMNSNFELSQHAFERALERKVDIKKIIRYADTFEIIEDYPGDKYSHSCLLLGILESNPIHVQVTRNRRMKLKIITIYEPDLKIWFDDYKRRR